MSVLGPDGRLPEYGPTDPPAPLDFGDGNDFLDDLWSDYGYGAAAATWDQTAKAGDLAVARKMVTTFVDTFATGDVRYDVSFDPNVRTAGTDLKAKKVVISPAPVMDPTLTAREAGLILTAMATHEAWHVRYGMKTANAVLRKWPGDPVAGRLSNILDDVRIEARGSEDYPGYAHVYAPALDYVARASLRNGKVKPPVGTPDYVVAAVRYGKYLDRTGTEAEADWWADWAVRYTANDKVALHVAGVAEALDRLAATPPPVTDPGTGGGGGDGEPGPEGTPGPSSGGDGEEGTKDGTPEGAGAGGDNGAAGKDAKDDEPGTGAGIDCGGTTTGESGGTGASLPDCFADGLDAAARANGAKEMSGALAQALVNDAAVLTGDGGERARCVDLSKDKRGSYRPSAAAAASFAAAFMRSRSGHTGIERGKNRGRIDSPSLTRIAFNDTRLFHRRNAPAPGKYLVWVMVDMSGSMRWRLGDTISMAKSLAVATRSMPNVRMEVFGWTSGNQKAVRASTRYGVYSAWKTGDNPAMIDNLTKVRMGGTPDASVMKFAKTAIRTELAPGETPLILFLTDGVGQASWMRENVDAARKAGTAVLGVASGYVSDWSMEATFGKDGWVGWDDTMDRTTRALAVRLGRIIK